MIDISIIFKGLSFLLKPASNYIGRQIVGEEILKRRQLQKTSLNPILQKAAEDIAEIIEPIGQARIDQICLFLESCEAEAIVRQIYAASILEAKERNLEQIGLTFLKAFASYTNIPEDELKDSAPQIFEILVVGCEKALSEAIDLGRLSAHEAKSQFRFKVLCAEIETMKKNLEFLSSSKKLNVPEILKFVDTYRQQIARLHGKLTPPYIDMEKKLPIDELYVSRNFVLENHDRKKRNIKEEEFFSSVYRTVLLGNPGGGKSTCSQKFCYDLVNPNSERLLNGRQITPILIVLRDYGVKKKKNDCSLLEFIELTAKTKYQITPPPGAFEYLLLNGYLAVNFDGLDELTDTSYRQEIRDDAELFCNLYPSVPVLITSRAIGYQEAPLDASFETYRLASFEGKQIKEYLRKWFAIDKNLSREQRNEKVASFLAQTKNLVDICSNPLMLGLMCNIYKGENYIPKNRPDLYARCAEMLFERWDRSRNIELPSMVKKIETKIRPLMRYLARWIYGNELLQSGVSERKLIIKAADYLCPKYFEDREDAEAVASAFIRFCRGRAWVFTDVGRNRNDEELYQFTHRTFLEYFTADRLVSINRTPVDLFEILQPKIVKQEWDVVCQLAVQIQNKQIEDAGSEILGLLLDEIEKAKDSDREEQWNLLHFCVRCLEFISPSVQIIRKIVTLVIEKCIEIGRISFEHRHSSCRTKFSHGIATGNLLNDLVRANEESIDDVLSIALEILSQKIKGYDEPESYLAVEILEYIGSLAAKRGFKQDLFILFADEIPKISQQDLPIAFLALTSNIISLSDFVKWYSLKDCFSNFGYRFYFGISLVSFAYNTLDNLCNRVPSGDYSHTKATIDEISELGEIFTTTSFPLTLDSEKIDWDGASFLLGNYSIHPDGVDNLAKSISGNFNALFGGLIIFAVSLEIEIEADTKEERKNLVDIDYSILWTLKEIEKHEIHFFHYVRYIFLARYSKPGKYDSEIAAELDRCNFSLEQRNIISGWIQRKINLVTIA